MKKWSFEEHIDRHITVRRVTSQELFPAVLLDYRRDGTAIFEITGERASQSEVQEKVVDTLYDINWEVIKK